MRYFTKAIFLGVVCTSLILPNVSVAKKVRWTAEVQNAATSSMAICIESLQRPHSTEKLKKAGFLGNKNFMKRVKRIPIPESLVGVKVTTFMRHKSKECTFLVWGIHFSEHRNAYKVLIDSFKARGFQKTTAPLSRGRVQDAYRKGAVLIRMRYRQKGGEVEIQMSRSKSDK